MRNPASHPAPKFADSNGTGSRRWAPVFRHVADSALRPCAGHECHQCGRQDRPIYAYFGRILDPAKAADPALAREEPDVSELCADCINGGNVRRSDWADVEAAVRRTASELARIREDFDRLPNIPLFLQRFDWPLCCEDWCEFTGSPSDLAGLLELTAGSRHWFEGRPASTGRDFKQGGPPESMREISGFRCLHCGSGYYTDQFT